MQTSIHNVKSVILKDVYTYEKDESLKHDKFYTRVLLVENEDGNTFELTLFSDDKKVLSF